MRPPRTRWQPQGCASSRCTPEKFKDLLKGVAKTWAEGLDSRGKHGSDALREFDATVATIPAK